MSGLDQVNHEISRACDAAARAVSSVRLIAVSKFQTVDAIREAIDAGQKCFGESRVQEAEPKIAELPDDLEWDFIGRIQSNKIRRIVEHFGVIHSVASEAHARAISRVAGELGRRPQIFLQVNQADEASKDGFSTHRLVEVLPELLELPHLEIVGLMVIPPIESETETSHWFSELRELRDQLEVQFACRLPRLSMGMSADFSEAIGAAATDIRVGSAIFGGRERPVP